MLKGHPNELDIGELLSTNVNPDSKKKKLKVALIGDCSTQFIAHALTVLFDRQGIAAEIYESGYGAAQIEILDVQSNLHRFSPDLVVFVNSVQTLRDRFLAGEDSAENFIRTHFSIVRASWEKLSEKGKIRIIHMNFAQPEERFFGNFDTKVPESFTQVVAELNRQISLLAIQFGNVFIADIHHISSWFGRKQWFDNRLWFHAKVFCAMEYIPHVSQSIVDIYVAATMRTVKCVVLDLDNTLWGGIIGDDGIDGIVLGGDGVGEAFVGFQEFLLKLRSRGVVLAVCSKNSPENARKPFQSHPEMKIRENDVAVFVANWNNKADNIKYIAEMLNIGTDSMVFIDDSAFERNLVRQTLPDVIVPEMPEDPAEYVQTIMKYNLFESSSFTSEDKQRAEMYREEAQRKELQISFSSTDDYLISLEMKGKLFRFNRVNMARIVQLIQRSNQFNLTTRRYSEAECEGFRKDEEGCYPFCISLEDKFGNYGLILASILKFEGSVAKVDLFLMSCRVVSRGVEQMAMNHIFEAAREQDCTTVVGEFIPSPKNAMVMEFYKNFGFTSKPGDGEAMIWTKKVSDYEPVKVHISAVREGSEAKVA